METSSEYSKMHSIRWKTWVSYKPSFFNRLLWCDVFRDLDSIGDNFRRFYIIQYVYSRNVDVDSILNTVVPGYTLLFGTSTEL